MELEAIRNKEARCVIGLMSGTSCDGIDAALVRIKGTGTHIRLKLVDFESVPYSDGFRARLMARHRDIATVCTLNYALGELLADGARRMVERAAAHDLTVDFVASHGHTICHVPPRPESEGFGTLQIGETAVIAERTGLPVISDFRAADMAAGGQGAPLVPYFDWLLFHRDHRTVACLNIGGIANITVVPPKLEDVFAFDTGPGNLVIDGAVQLLSKGERVMDVDGEMAASGTVIEEFLGYLLDHPYFDRMPPKSTGREDFGPEAFLRDALMARRQKYSPEDLVATVTLAVAKSIVHAYERFIAPKHTLARLIVSGGGAYNPVLLGKLKEELPNMVVRTSDDYQLRSDAREAMAFAILGNEAICGTPSNVPKATGARHPAILGKFTPGGGERTP